MRIIDTPYTYARQSVLHAMKPFARFTPDGVVWEDRAETSVDAVIGCTGFKPALGHLASLGAVTGDCRVEVTDACAVNKPSLWLVGFGEWTGSAVTRTARSTVAEIEQFLVKAEA